MSHAPNDLLLPDDFFSHEALELSVEMIIDNNPGLASAIKKAMDQITPAPSHLKHKHFLGEMYFNAQVLEALQAHTIGKIVSALIELGEQALQSHNVSAEYVSILRTLIDDWVQLTEWILKNSISNKNSIH